MASGPRTAIGSAVNNVVLLRQIALLGLTAWSASLSLQEVIR